VTRGDLCGDRQPQAGSGAVVLSSPESGSRPRQILVGQPGAVVADDEFDSLGRLLGRHGNRGALTGVAHRVLQRHVEQLFHVMASELRRTPWTIRAVEQLLILAVEDRLPVRHALLDHVRKVRGLRRCDGQADLAAAADLLRACQA
jgi:hypothetical protein